MAFQVGLPSGRHHRTLLRARAEECPGLSQGRAPRESGDSSRFVSFRARVCPKARRPQAAADRPRLPHLEGRA
jgi:hypothetical protein